MLRIRFLTLSVTLGSLALMMACGADSRRTEHEETLSSNASAKPLARSYVAQVERTMPPPITVTLRLGKGGRARMTYQIAIARSYREERGRWLREDGHVVLNFEASEHAEDPLPSPLRLLIKPGMLVAPAGSLAPDEVSFLPSQPRG